MGDPFEAYRIDEKPLEPAFAKLSELISGLVKAEADVFVAEAALKKAQESRRLLSEKMIPDCMEEMGLKEFTTNSGTKVIVEKNIHASIGNRKAEAFTWLITHGHGGMIKHSVEIAFNREQTDQAKAVFAELLTKDSAGVRQNLKVEPATLTSWVKSQLEEGNDIPHDIFGIFEQKIAEVKSKVSSE
jgi:hypothetical protein